MKTMSRCLEEKDISPHSEAARDYIWERRNSLLLRKPQTESVRQQTGWEENFFYFFLTILKVVAKESAASDPYSIINYGLGGQIEVNIVLHLIWMCWQFQVHVDYWGKENKRAGLVQSNCGRFIKISFSSHQPDNRQSMKEEPALLLS